MKRQQGQRRSNQKVWPVLLGMIRQELGLAGDSKKEDYQQADVKEKCFCSLFCFMLLLNHSFIHPID